MPRRNQELDSIYSINLVEARLESDFSKDQNNLPHIPEYSNG